MANYSVNSSESLLQNFLEDTQSGMGKFASAVSPKTNVSLDDIMTRLDKAISKTAGAMEEEAALMEQERQPMVDDSQVMASEMIAESAEKVNNAANVVSQAANTAAQVSQEAVGVAQEVAQTVEAVKTQPAPAPEGEMPAEPTPEELDQAIETVASAIVEAFEKEGARGMYNNKTAGIFDSLKGLGSSALAGMKAHPYLTGAGALGAGALGALGAYGLHRLNSNNVDPEFMQALVESGVVPPGMSPEEWVEANPEEAAAIYGSMMNEEEMSPLDVVASSVLYDYDKTAGIGSAAKGAWNAMGRGARAAGAGIGRGYQAFRNGSRAAGTVINQGARAAGRKMRKHPYITGGAAAGLLGAGAGAYHLLRSNDQQVLEENPELMEVLASCAEQYILEKHASGEIQLDDKTAGIFSNGLNAIKGLGSSALAGMKAHPYLTGAGVLGAGAAGLGLNALHNSFSSRMGEVAEALLASGVVPPGEDPIAWADANPNEAQAALEAMMAQDAQGSELEALASSYNEYDKTAKSWGGFGPGTHTNAGKAGKSMFGRLKNINPRIAAALGAAGLGAAGLGTYLATRGGNEEDEMFDESLEALAALGAFSLEKTAGMNNGIEGAELIKLAASAYDNLNSVNGTYAYNGDPRSPINALAALGATVLEKYAGINSGFSSSDEVAIIKEASVAYDKI